MNNSRTLEIVLRLQDEASKQIQAFEKRTASLRDNLATTAKVSGVAFAGLAGAIGFAVSKASDMQSLMFGLEAVAGSAENATKQFTRLKDVAKLPGLGLEEAVRGSINLQSAGLSAQIAERSLMAFGNALATVGKGKAELDGVVLALQQIASKGKISAEEINQLNERLPQIRKAMQSAFGTSNTELLNEMGISSTEFIEKIVSEFEKLPKVTGGAKVAFENLSDSIKILTAEVGTAFLPAVEKVVVAVAPIVEKMAEWVAENPKVVFTVGAVALSITGLVASLSSLGLIILAIKPAIVAIGAVIGGLSIPVAIVIASLATIGASIAYLAINWREHWETIKWTLQIAGEFIKNTLFFIVGVINGILKKLNTEWTLSWDTIKNTVIDTWTAIKSFISNTIDSVIKIIEPAIQKIQRLIDLASQVGGAVGSTVKKFGSNVASGVQGLIESGKKALNVNDAIIAPNGRIITTHPDDYLIATKNPSSLGGSGGINLTITGNTFMSDEDTAERIGNMIVNKLKLTTQI